MVKKRNRRTRKKYKKGGGVSNDELQECNNRLKSQGVKSMVNRRNMCIESKGEAGKKAEQEPAPAQSEQPTQPVQGPGVESVIAPLEEESEQPTQPVQGPGVQSVIAPLEEEPKKPKKPKIQKSQKMKDRVSALEKKFGETDRQKGRKALRTTVGSCRAAVDKKGRKYYYNEAEESTWDPTDEVCHPKDGIEKTGNKSGDCIGARYKGGEEYWYHPTKQFSTHNKNHPDCHSVEGTYKTGVDSDVPLTPGFKVNKSVTQKPQPQESKKIEEEKKSNVECSELSNTKCKKSPDCDLVTKRNKKNPKKKKVKKCLPKKKGGKRTKRKKSRKKGKKSRKSRR